jgi:hypothetical protein
MLDITEALLDQDHCIDTTTAPSCSSIPSVHIRYGKIQVHNDRLIESLAPSMRPIRRRNGTVDDTRLPPAHAATQGLPVTPRRHVWVPTHAACAKTRECRGSLVIKVLTRAALALTLPLPLPPGDIPSMPYG